MAAKVRHLLFRAGRYYARRGVPEKLRSIVGKSELLEALGAGRSEALRRLPGAIHQMQDTLEAARREARAVQTTTPRKGRTLSARQMALAHYADQMRFDDELRNSDDRYAHGFIDEDYVAQLRRAVSGAAPNDELQKTVGYILHKFQANRNTTATPGSPEWREVGRALATAELESLARTAERDDGDFTGEPSNPILIKTADPTTATDPLSARIIGPESTKTLKELIPTLIAERGASLSTNHEIYVTARMFEEYLEEDRPVYSRSLEPSSPRR
jgi:hypothetical protein